VILEDLAGPFRSPALDVAGWVQAAGYVNVEAADVTVVAGRLG